MLDNILNYLKNSKQIVHIKKMALDLKIEESALEEMLHYLAKKNKIGISIQSTKGPADQCSGCAFCDKGKEGSIKYYYLLKK